MRKNALALALAAAAPAVAQLPPPGSVRMPSVSAPAAPAAPSAPAAPRTGKGPVERGTVLEEVAGKVAGIDRKAHHLEVETASGPVTLSLDRNTMVYTATGLGTVLDIKPGVQVRAGRSADHLAYWVQVRAAPAAPASTPAQGTGPAGGGSAPASEGTRPGAGPAPAPPATPDAATGTGASGPAGGGPPR